MGSTHVASHFHFVSRDWCDTIRKNNVSEPMQRSFMAAIRRLSIDAGGPMRVAVIDQTGKVYGRLAEALASDETTAEQADQTRSGPDMPGRAFHLEQVPSVGPDAEAQRAQLDQRLRAREIDGYLVLPPDFMDHGKAEFFNNNPGDVLSRRILQSALNRAVREQRLIEAKVDSETRQGLFKPAELESVKIGAAGEERDSGAGFVLVFSSFRNASFWLCNIRKASSISNRVALRLNAATNSAAIFRTRR